MKPRYQKLLRDAWLERGRFAAMVGAITAALVAVGSVLGAWAILTREIRRNYLETHPADATLELGVDVDAAALAELRARPEVATAEAGEVLRARLSTPDGLRPVLVFVADTPATATLAVQALEAGAWPLPDGSAALERSAASLFRLAPGDVLDLRFAGGERVTLPVSTLVHDPGLAPAWQERMAYVYVSRTTLSGALGHPAALHDLRVTFRDRASTEDVDRAAQALAASLTAEGVPVHALRVPPFERHPHQRQMSTLLLVLASFSGLSLVLGAIVVATSLEALLARQVREIGVMKTLGATRRQLVGAYSLLVASLGLAASILAIPLGLGGAAGLSTAVSRLLNFTLESRLPPGWVPAGVLAAGIGVPLLLSSAPIFRAARVTVREALDQHGVAAGTLRPWMASWPRALRTVVRRPGRLALNLALFASAGAMFVTAQDVSAGWAANLAKLSETRFDDVEVRFAAPVDEATLASLSAIPGVRRVEPWGYAGAAFATGEAVDVSRTWPDRGHGSLSLFGVPPDTTLVALPVTAGRWLRPDDAGDVAVINQGALAQRPGVAIGDTLSVSVEGVSRAWTVIGIVEEIGSSGAIYVPKAAFPAEAGTAAVVRVAGGAPGAVEAALDAAPIDAVIPRDELERAVGGHLALLVQSLTGMALVMALVGGAGLASSAAVAVIERTRELGVEKTLGATPAQITRRFLAEALWVSGASVLLAWAGAVPLTLLMNAVIGQVGFLAPLPFAFDGVAAAEWAVLAAVITVAATVPPALRAGELTVQEALAAT